MIESRNRNAVYELPPPVGLFRRLSLPLVLKNTAYALLYIATYWALDGFSFIYTVDALDITPWNPPVAASVVLLFLLGLSWSPLLFVAAFTFRLLFEHVDAPAIFIVITSGCEALIYTAAVWLMKTRFKIDPRLSTLRDVVIFAATITIAAGCMAIAYVLTYYFAGLIMPANILPLIAEYWAGDGLGVLVLAPFFLISWPLKKIGARLRRLLTVEMIVQILLVIGLVIAAFWLDKREIHIFYTFFIPVVWVAVKNGLSRVPGILLTLQTSIILCSWEMNVSPYVTTKFLPFIVVVIAWTGLILGSVIDERERVKLSITKSDARLKAILNMAPDCMLIVDMQGLVVTTNKNFAQLYGVDTPEHVAGMHIEKIIPTFYPELNGETFLLLADGMDIPIEISSSKVPVGDKFSSILTIRDITSRKRAEIQLRQRRAVTEQASRTNLTGGLAAVLAHELNQPLSAIMSYASACVKIIASTDNPPPRVAEQLEKVTVQARRAGDIIRRLREFFQNSSVEIAKVDIAEIVNEAVMLLEDEIMQTQADIEILIPERLTAAIDRIQIEQVLINLIKNSLEALKSNSPDKKRIRITGALSMRGDIEITVTDTGPGISPEIADQLFNPFVTTRLSGMGLGLTISRSIVEAHNGRLWAELESASGVTMHFTIPAFQEA